MRAEFEAMPPMQVEEPGATGPRLNVLGSILKYLPNLRAMVELKSQGTMHNR